MDGKVDEVLASCQGKGVKRAFFSATLGPEVHELALSVLRDPICIKVGQVSAICGYTLCIYNTYELIWCDFATRIMLGHLQSIKG